MQISKYQVFMRVVEEQSLTKAAEVLNYTQSGVSHIVKKLEKELGCTLLIRSNTDFKLTSEGEKMLGVIREIANSEEKLSQISSDITGIQTGTIRIGTMCSVSAQWLPHIIKKFSLDYPNIHFELRDSDYEISEKLLETDALDCAFLPKPVSKNISHELLYMDKYYAVIPRGHKWSDLERIPIHYFINEPFITPTEGMDYRLGDLFRTHKVKPKSMIYAKDDFGTLSLVYAGLGVTILSKLFLDCFTPDVEIKDLETEAYRDLGFCMHMGNNIPPATAKFREYVRQWVKDNID